MTEQDDDAMRRLVRRADPAASLTPLRIDEMNRLTEQAMSTTDRTPASARPRAPRRTALLAGGLATLAAATAAAVVLPAVLAGGGTTTVLTQPEPVDPLSSICLQLTPESVASLAETAFRAEVTGIDGGTVELRVTDRFKGDVGERVAVPQGENTVIDGGPIAFRDGQAYLLATADATVLTCGVSDVESPELRAIYEQAFA